MSTERTDFYIYVYKDPRKDPPEPIYVGKGTGKRFKQHINCTHNSILARKITHIKEANLLPIIEIIKDNLTEEMAFALEVELIKKYGRIKLNTGTLCNFTNGGSGAPGRLHYESTLKLFSEQRKGKKQTPKQYEANKNRKHSEETKLKMSSAHAGIRRLTIEQYRLNGQLTKGKPMHSDIQKEKWSKIRRGRKQTAEHIERSKKSRIVNDIKRKAALGEEGYRLYKKNIYDKMIATKRSRIPDHGTYGMYHRYKCRCPICIEYNRLVYCKKIKRKKERGL
jgi:hypothetical protein